jgi:hypothetical protein
MRMRYMIGNITVPFTPAGVITCGAGKLEQFSFK